MSLIRLHITTEGKSELNFVRDVLAEYLMINIGMETMMGQCRHFSEWVNKLLSLGETHT